MDGKSLTEALDVLLQESDTSAYVDTKFSFDCLWKAATEFVKKTRCLSATQSITTVASQSNYDLNADFLQLYMYDSYNRYFVKWYDGTAYNFIFFRDYDKVMYGANTQAVALPYNFSIIDGGSPTTLESGSIHGYCTSNSVYLIDSAAPFASASVGDDVHNLDAECNGIVSAVTSTSQLTTEMYGGSTSLWTTGDEYQVVKQRKKQLVLDPPPLTSGCIVTVYYIKRPDPVYNFWHGYPIDNQYMMALVQYAAWMYKYKDREPNFGDAFYKYWEAQVRSACKDLNKSFNRMGYKVNKIKRAYDDRSYR